MPYAKKTSHQHGKTFDVKPSKQTEKEATPTGRKRTQFLAIHPSKVETVAAKFGADDAELMQLLTLWPRLARETKEEIFSLVHACLTRKES